MKDDLEYFDHVNEVEVEDKENDPKTDIENEGVSVHEVYEKSYKVPFDDKFYNTDKNENLF